MSNRKKLLSKATILGLLDESDKQNGIEKLLQECRKIKDDDPLKDICMELKQISENLRYIGDTLNCAQFIDSRYAVDYSKYNVKDKNHE